MFKTILAFIKAHTIATAITTTVVVSTAVATPIIINQVQKQPEQEVAQIQENIIDNSVIENKIEENTETPEENTTVPEEEQPKVETPKETKPNNTETPKKDVPQTTTKPDNKPVEKDTTPNYISLGSIQYDTNNKVVLSYGRTQDRATWLANYSSLRSSYEKSAKQAMISDGKNGQYSKGYCDYKIEQWKADGAIRQEALDYYKAHKDEIELTDQNTFLYKGKYWEGNMEILEAYITVTVPRSIRDWNGWKESSPQYSPNEQVWRDKIVELDKAYNYIKSH